MADDAYRARNRVSAIATLSRARGVDLPSAPADEVCSLGRGNKECRYRVTGCDALRVIFMGEGKVGPYQLCIDDVRKLREHIKADESARHIIFVTNKRPPAPVMVSLLNAWVESGGIDRWEVLYYSDFAVRKHIMLPTSFRIVDPATVPASMCAAMSASGDVNARVLGARPGDVVRIESACPENGAVVSFRRVA
jgi:hypothetical protein